MDDSEIDWTLSEHEKTFLLPGETEIDHATMRRRIQQYYTQIWGSNDYRPDFEAGQAAIREAKRMLIEVIDVNTNEVRHVIKR